MADNVQQEETSGVLPRRWPVSPTDDRTPRLVELSEDDATAVFDALSSETARALLSELHEDPQTASDLAETVGTSVQNVHYHLEKFEDADLVEVRDTWYSSRGAEMDVYAPTNHSLVLYTGNHPENPSLGDALTRLLGGIGILGVASILVDQLARRLADPTGATDGDLIRGPVSSHPDPTAFEISGVTVSPGLVFFVGGLFVLLIGMGWWYNRS